MAWLLNDRVRARWLKHRRCDRITAWAEAEAQESVKEVDQR
jgi:hypothetical protein